MEWEVQKEMTSTFPLGLVGWLSVPSAGGVKWCLYISTGLKKGVQEPERIFPPPPQSELRSFALKYRSLGLSRGCRLGSSWHLFPLMGHSTGRHLKTLWAGDKDMDSWSQRVQTTLKSHDNHGSFIWGLPEVTSRPLGGRKH